MNLLLECGRISQNALAFGPYTSATSRSKFGFFSAWSFRATPQAVAMRSRIVSECPLYSPSSRRAITDYVVPTLFGQFGLSQTSILSHLADQESQVNLMQGALERLAAGCASSHPPLDNLAVPVALNNLPHSLNPFRIASLSFCDPV